MKRVELDLLLSYMLLLQDSILLAALEGIRLSPILFVTRSYEGKLACLVIVTMLVTGMVGIGIGMIAATIVVNWCEFLGGERSSR